MACAKDLNVFDGPDSVRNYFDPEFGPPIPLVEIPECLNPLRADGVRIYAKMMSMHPATNVKVVPAMNLLEKGIKPGKTKTIVEASSGSTVISMSLVARAFHGIDDVQAFLSNKSGDAKLKLMQFFGLGITLFGGPGQSTPVDERGSNRCAVRESLKDESVCCPNQYQNDDNWKGHVRWTAPQIHKQLPDINVIAASMGTSGTMTGLGTYFKDAKPDVFRIAVCTNTAERVPGPREFSLMEEVQFPYQSSMDALEEVGAKDSFSASLDLTRQGIVCGPSSGLTLHGLIQRLQKRKQDGTLSQLAGPSGEIKCVFLCCDLPFQYVNEYFDKLPADKFRPMKNEELLYVDKYRYDDAWEMEPTSAIDAFFSLPADITSSATTEHLETILAAKNTTQVLDFRRRADYDAFHLPNSVNVPLETLSQGAASGSPFSDPANECGMLVSLWKELESVFGANASADVLMGMLRGKKVLTLCYDGDSSRVANSVLQAKGIDAVCIRGGLNALSKVQLPAPGAVSGQPLVGFTTVAV